MVADSDSEVRSQTQNSLTEQGYFVVPAADGTEALALIQNNSLDVVVAQVGLPKHGGLEIFRAAQDKSHPVPVILLADANTIAAAANGVREGAFDYLVKPLDDVNRLALLIDRAAGQATTPRRASPGTAAAPAAPSSTPDKPSDLMQALAQNQDLNAILNQFATEFARLARATHTFVLLPHNDGQLHLSASHGFTTRAEAGRTYANTIGEAFALRIATAKAQKWLPTGASPTAANAFGLPLLFQDQIMGIAIAQQTPPQETFTPTMLAAIQNLALQAAIAIEMARLSARVKRLEPRDPITGLFSREHFFEFADRDFRRAWRFNQTLCTLVMDVDEFGSMHLTLGPQETDQVMRRIAHVVREHVRKVDLVGRLNPHTIGFVLWMAQKEHGLAIAERLRQLIAEIEVQTEEDTWQVTAELWSCRVSQSSSSVFDLFGIADQALPHGKARRRNRVEGF